MPPNEARSSHPLIEIQTIRFHEGYMPSMRQPSLIARLHIDPDIGSQTLTRFDGAVTELLSGYHPAENSKRFGPFNVCEHLITAMETLLETAGMPVLSHGYVEAHTDEAFEIVLPALDREHSGTVAALRWMCDLMNATDDTAFRQTLTHHFPSLLSLLRKEAPQGINPIRMLEAADRLAIPWHYLANGIYRFGWGSRSRLFNSTLTDATSMISVAAAGNKATTAHMLREAGLPVPEHAEARDQLHALALAETLGYPVVIKPIGQSQGRGVAAGLKTPGAVKKAYKQADLISPHILVEKHFEGNDYRMHVCNGRVYLAYQRIPGGVTGDAKNTIEALLAHLNAERQPQGNTPMLKPIPLDEEALELLGEQQLTPESIPATGQYVRLRRIANVSTGGTAVLFDDLNEIHPDNRRLAVRAAAALRLDIAAVDFLSPDIRRSWMETGAVICEVNAQPQIGEVPYYDRLLKCVMGENGRIPVVVLLGTRHDQPWLEHFVRRAAGHGRTVGISCEDKVSIAGEIVSNTAGNAYEGSLVLIGDPGVDVAVVCIPEPALPDNGLAVDRFDALVVSLPEKAPGPWIRLSKTLLPMCAGPVIIDNSGNHADTIADALAGEKTSVVRTEQIPALLEPLIC